MRKIAYFLAFLGMLIANNGLLAQNKIKRTMTVNELTWGNKDYIGIEKKDRLQWLGDNIIYVNKDIIKIINPKNQKESDLLSVKDFDAIEGFNSTNLKSIPYFMVIGENKDKLLLYPNKGTLIFDPIKKEIIARSDNALYSNQAFSISPNLHNFAYVKDHNLYVSSFKNQENKNIGKYQIEDVQLSTDGSEAIVYGQSVHQNEFGIDGGLFWSNDGSKLAFYRMDQSMIKPYPIANIHLDKKLDSKNQYYPMAGENSHHVTLGVYDLKTKKTIYLEQSQDKETYLTNISFSPDAKRIYIAELNRAQNNMQLAEYDANSGKRIRVLFEESDEHYVEPLYPMYFNPNNPKEFLWVSRRNAWRHIYLYDIDKGLKKQLTKGEWEVEGVIGFDKEGKNFYYTSTEISPLDRNTYSLNIKNAKRKVVDARPGFHNTQISANAKYYLDSFESIDVANVSTLGRTSDFKAIKIIDESQNPQKDYLMPIIKLDTIISADGKTPLYAKMILPNDFDPNKKYPTIVYVYNGPHAQLVQNRRNMATMPFSLHAANNGYIIFTVDGRGSAARGAKFEQVIHRNLGVNEMNDQLEGVKYLKSLPYVDQDRLGVYGWSYGGFMTINLLTSFPDVFKVGVAGGPVTNWSLYEIMYGERYMDKPQENLEGYDNNNLIKKAKNLKARLLLIHGTNDPVVMWQHSLAFMKAAVDANTYPDYMVYPGHLHNVTGKDRVHLNNTILRYFDDHLK